MYIIVKLWCRHSNNILSISYQYYTDTTLTLYRRSINTIQTLFTLHLYSNGILPTLYKHSIKIVQTLYWHYTKIIALETNNFVFGCLFETFLLFCIIFWDMSNDVNIITKFCFGHFIDTLTTLYLHYKLNQIVDSTLYKNSNDFDSIFYVVNLIDSNFVLRCCVRLFYFLNFT